MARNTTNNPAGNSWLFGNSNAYRYCLLISGGSNILVQAGAGPVEVNDYTTTVNQDFLVDAVFLTGGTPASLLTGYDAAGIHATTSNTVLTGAGGSFCVGNTANGSAGDSWGGFIYEVIFYNNQISTNANKAILFYIKSRYGIQTGV